MYAISAGSIYTPDKKINNHSILVDGDKIVDLVADNEQVLLKGVPIINASELIVTPGFIDLQVNGAFGEDFTADPSKIWSVASGLSRYGVTSFLPTIITSPLETISKAQEVIQNAPPKDFKGSTPIGLHIEGPFLNPEKKGAHNSQHLRLPSIDDYKKISRENGVLLTTLAPELSDALELIDYLRSNGVIISAGHSQATYDQAMQALDHGVKYGTHIFNAMRSLHQHEPGIVGALITDSRPFIGLIADGIHVHPAVVNIIWKTVGKDRLTLVTDAMAALGMPPGDYQIGDQKVIVDHSSARLENGVLAGSILSLDSALRNLLQMTSCSLEQGLQTITSNPATLLNMDHKIGKIEPGYIADITILSSQLKVMMTICHGQITHQVGPL